MESQYIGSN